MKPLGFGIIGVGNIAPVHAAAIQHSPGAELVAVATRNPERGQAFVAQHGGTWYADYRDLLARPEVAAVTICTPHDLHLPMTVDAAAAGKHVLCEKPMARTAAECDAMIAACRQAGVTLGVILQSRFEPLTRQLKSLVATEQLGRLLWGSAAVIWHRTDEYYRSGPWRGTWAHEGGGVLINQAIHTIDVLLWCLGRPDRVTAQVRTFNHQIEVEDTALAILEYGDGRLGLIQATTAAFPGYPEKVEIYGSRGSAIYAKGQGRLEWHLTEPRRDEVVETGSSSGAARPMDITAEAHTANFRDFIAAVHDHRPPVLDGEVGRLSVEVVECLYQSARTGATVTLP